MLGALLLAAVVAAPPPAPSPSPPDVQVRVTVARPYLVLGADTGAEVSIEVVGPGAEGFAPTRLLATVGRLQVPQAVPGAAARFTARYDAPAEIYPQVALLVVELASTAGGGGGTRARGAARLPLHGNTEVPLRTEPGASVTVRVLDRTFGPASADKQGHVKIPVEVPPGVRAGVARAIDHNGSLRETDVDLQPAPFPRVLVIAPPSMEAGSFGEVAVLGVEPNGDWTPPARLSLRASDGLVHPLGGAGAGEARFLVEAPRLVRNGALALTAGAAGAPGTPAGQPVHADLAVPLHAGTPHALTVTPSPRRLVIGGGGSARVVISAADRFGNPVSAVGAAAFVDHQPVTPQMLPGGQGLLTLAAPPRYTGVDRYQIEVALGTVRAAEEVRLSGGAPAHLTLELGAARLVADGRNSTELRVRAVDGRGTPTMIPGLSWETPGGRIRNVRMPREGEYVAEFVPYRAQDAHHEPVAVMASRALRAGASLEVTPAPSRVMAAARVGFFSNLGHAAGPAAFVEALTPIPIGGLRFTAGLAVGYARNDLASTLPASSPDHPALPVRLVVDQLPLLAMARLRLPGPSRPELSLEAAGGASLAQTRLTVPGVDSMLPTTVRASARAPVWSVGAEAAFPLRAGRLIVGVRYLSVVFGHTSQGDDLRGNTIGLLGDVGYRLIW